MEEKNKVFRYRVDFFYQSIAIYAVTLVLYLVVRSFISEQSLPVIWKDPFLYLLSAIILISVVALAYNMIMKRRIVIEPSTLRFISAARERVIDRSNVRYVRFSRERDAHIGKVNRVVKIGLKDRRRPARIHPTSFEDRNELVHQLKNWAGPLAVSGRVGRRVRTTDGGSIRRGNRRRK